MIARYQIFGTVFQCLITDGTKAMTNFNVILIFPLSRHDDLKQMLDSNKDHLKLEAMKRIIGMVAKV